MKAYRIAAAAAAIDKK